MADKYYIRKGEFKGDPLWTDSSYVFYSTVLDESEYRQLEDCKEALTPVYTVPGLVYILTTTFVLGLLFGGILL